jgi:hypothetical protein
MIAARMPLISAVFLRQVPHSQNIPVEEDGEPVVLHFSAVLLTGVVLFVLSAGRGLNSINKVITDVPPASLECIAYSDLSSNKYQTLFSIDTHNSY